MWLLVNSSLNQRVATLFLISVGGLYGVGLSFAQTNSTTATSDTSSGLLAVQQAFSQEQAVLAGEQSDLISQGATQQQMNEWATLHSVELAAQATRAKIMGAASYLQVDPVIDEVTVPDNASQAMSAFIVARANLVNDLSQTHNQLIQNLGTAVQSLPLTAGGLAQIQQMQETERQTFLQYYGSQVQELALQLPNIIAEWNAQPEAIEDLGTNFISPLLQVTSEYDTFKSIHDELTFNQVNLLNQYSTASSSQRIAVLKQWTLENAALISQLIASAQSLSASTPN